MSTPSPTPLPQGSGSDQPATEGEVRKPASRSAALISDIRTGLDDLARGEYMECGNEAELRDFFDRVKARGRESLIHTASGCLS